MAFEIQQQADIYDTIFMIYKCVGQYDFNIPYDFIEHIRTNPNCYGLYQLLEIFLSVRTGCVPNSPILISPSSHDIIHEFAAVYNIRMSSIFNKKNTEKLTALFDKVNIYLTDMNIHTSRANVLKLLHDKISEKLDIDPIYNILLNNICNKIIIDVEAQRYSREELNIKIDEISKIDPSIPVNYINFAFTKNKLISEDADIPSITGCLDILFPHENVHPILKKYKDLMSLLLESRILSRMRIAKKYEYASYKIIHIPYNDYSDLYNHTLRTMSLCFECDIIQNQTMYIEYIDSLIQNKSTMINTCLLADYMALLYKINKHKEVYNIYIMYKESILYGINRAPILNEIMMYIMYYTVASSIYIHKPSFERDFVNILNRHADNINNPKHILICQKIRGIAQSVIDREDYIYRIGYEIIGNPKIDETCIICYESIDEDNYQVVRCVNCSRELGHIGCVAAWLVSNISCPICRNID